MRTTMVSDLKTTLNPEQHEAVTSPYGHHLVLAGAGSGKTRVLVHRMRYLIKEMNESPYSILAVTFTNKSANEMKERLQQLLNCPMSGIWVGTFHSLAHRLLRIHYQDAGLPEQFQILDSEEQCRSIRRLMKSLNIDETRWPVKQTQWYINSKKDEGLRFSHIDPKENPFDKTMLKVYQVYEAACREGNVIDFSELLLRCHELFLTRSDLLQRYQQRFKHILVDEFQDTNTIQYAWLRLLAGESMMVVGDDDQSIYGWRGAKIENIHRFSKDFSSVSVIRLEQNYRSTGNILTAANHLIAHNGDRFGKQLWTEHDSGEPISQYKAFNEIDEARFVVGMIQQWVSEGHLLRECAILYRSNAQSRVIEEALIQVNMAYRIYGGFRFFERAEIKDALAYLRLLLRVDDDGAFERVVNFPPRGIGERTVQQLRETAKETGCSLWQSMLHLIQGRALPKRAEQALLTFKTLIDAMRDSTGTLAVNEQVENVLFQTGLAAHYEKDRTEKGRAKSENLKELVGAAKQFERPDGEREDASLLSIFLAHAALDAGENQSDASNDCVQVMTLHSAKGLEFPVVFLVGMEDGVFPTMHAIESPRGLPEERRLCYVGITRAMHKLYITHAECRRLYGREEYHRPSRFIKEIPPKLLQQVRLRTLREPTSSMFASDFARMPSSGNAFVNLGQRVQHTTFGEGIILNHEGDGINARVQVQFDHVGTKWLMIEKANLTAI